NIVQIFEVGEHQGQPFISLEFCPGGSLGRRLGGRPVDAREAAELVETLSRAIEAAHGAKGVQRGLKAANVLLTADGTPKITGFGLARKLDEQGLTQDGQVIGLARKLAYEGLTQDGQVIGTPPWMPPEQAQGKTESLGP